MCHSAGPPEYLAELLNRALIKGLERAGDIRLIEARKPRLTELQRQILAGILEKAPPHPSAHGFLQGRSIQTFIAPHVSQRVSRRGTSVPPVDWWCAAESVGAIPVIFQLRR